MDHFGQFEAPLFRFNAAPVITESGELAGAIETLEDATDTKRIEERLNDQFRFLQDILDSIPNPVYYKDRLGRYIGSNRAFEEFVGLPKKGLFGKSVKDILSGESAEELLELSRKCLSTALPQLLETNIERADGKMRRVIVTAAPFFDKKCKPSGMVETIVDITSRYALEAEVKKLSLAIEQSHVSIVITNTEGTIEYVSPRYCQITGYRKDELLGRNPRILKSGETSPDVYADMWKTITSGREWHGELHNKKSNGELYWDATTISPLFDDSGAIMGYLANKEEITARKEAEQLLAESKAELENNHAKLETLFKWVRTIAKVEWEQTLDSLRDLIILTDPRGKVRRCNRLLYQLADKAHDKIIGLDWQDILAEAGFSIVLSSEMSGEVSHKASNRTYDLSMYNITSPENNEVTGRVLSLVDTTELHGLTEKLQKAYDELQTTQIKVFQQEKLASIGQLAAGVAHEINNPMAFISSNLTTLGKYFERAKEFSTALSTALSTPENVVGNVADWVNAEQKRLKIDYIFGDSAKMIEESLEGAQRVRRIVQDLKSFSRVDDTEQKRADLHECLDSTIGIAWNEIKYVATLTKDYGDIPAVLCYPQQLNQVFMNLLVNAAHAISGTGEIRIRTWQGGGRCCISISDTGCGIPEENKNACLSRFTTKEVGKGTGLGLSVSYDIVKKHHGEIIVQSEVGKGTTFTVTLPVNGVTQE